MLKVNEVFLGIQGESSHMGKPCVFVRLTGCDLDCVYCDTRYARAEGDDCRVEDVLARVEKFGCRLVNVTGGEPLLQPVSLVLMENLLARDYDVVLETNGARDVSLVPRGVTKVVDIKCPGSGESDRCRYDNVHFLEKHDNVKFVIMNRKDYDWARSVMERFELARRCEVLFSPAWGWMEPRVLAEWIVDDVLPVRFQPQLHKYLWGDQRGK
ncbi:MAG: radical SAM protein [bacterium]